MKDLQARAASELAEISAVERRTKAALTYRSASAFLILWGALVAVGAGLNQAFPDGSEAIWLGVDALGLLATCGIALHRVRNSPSEQGVWPTVGGFLILGAYGVAWSYLLAPAGHDRIAVFWSTLMMMGYVVAGLYVGPLFALLGLAGTAVSFAAFFFAGQWLHLWIGATYVFGLMFGGVLLRRLGAGD
jgi:hypothetical protein